MCLSSAQSGRATENCLRTDTSCAAKIAALQRTAWHGVVSTSGCAGPVSQPLVTGMYQSVAHLDRVLSMQCAWWWWWLVWELPCRLVLFFLPLLCTAILRSTSPNSWQRGRNVFQLFSSWLSGWLAIGLAGYRVAQSYLSFRADPFLASPGGIGGFCALPPPSLDSNDGARPIICHGTQNTRE